MQVLRALSIAAAVSTATGAFACEIHSTAPQALTEASTIALLNEPILLNRWDVTQAERLQADLVSAANEPILLNRDVASADPQVAEEQALSWDDLDLLPSPMALANVEPGELRVLVDDGGIPLIDVDFTGSTGASANKFQRAELAIDGFEDR